MNVGCLIVDYKGIGEVPSFYCGDNEVPIKASPCSPWPVLSKVLRQRSPQDTAAVQTLLPRGPWDLGVAVCCNGDQNPILEL